MTSFIKYDLIAHLCFLLDNCNDSSRWFAISSSHIYAVPVPHINLDARNICAGSDTQCFGDDALICVNLSGDKTKP